MFRILFIFIFMGQMLMAQVGIGTTNPQGALDISSSTLGLVLPRVTQLESVTNNNSGLAEDGTVVYDVSRNKTCFRISNTWICLDNSAVLAVETVSPSPPPPVNNQITENRTPVASRSKKPGEQ